MISHLSNQYVNHIPGISASVPFVEINKTSKPENIVASDYITINEEANGQPISNADNTESFPVFSGKSITAPDSFRRQIVNYLEQQGADLSALSNTTFPQSTSVRDLSGHITPVNTSLADGTTVNISYVNDGTANIQLSLSNGQKLEVNGITSNVRFSRDENNAIQMVTSETTTTFDGNGNVISTADGGNPLAGTDGNDIIINFDGSEVNGGDGNDLIVNYASNSTIYGGSGNDKVLIASKNHNSQNGALDQNVNVYLGDGDDSLEMGDAGHSMINIDGGNGNDSILIGNLLGVSANINGGFGNDKITVGKIHGSSDNSVMISGGEDDDSIKINEMLGPVARISGDAGNDKISVGKLYGRPFAGSSLVNGGSGNDIINIGYASDSVIDGGDGNNEISIDEMFRSLLVNGSGDDIINVNKMLSSMILSTEKLESELWTDKQEKVSNSEDFDEAQENTSEFKNYIANYYGTDVEKNSSISNIV